LGCNKKVLRMTPVKTKPLLKRKCSIKTRVLLGTYELKLKRPNNGRSKNRIKKTITARPLKRKKERFKKISIRKKFKYMPQPGIHESAPQGIQGPAGPQGTQGFAGPQGIQGLAGLQGAQGPAGLQGAQGPAGLQGTPGPAGLQGTPGPAGLQGITGPAGLQGTPGPAGLQGTPGPAGLQGIPGPAGLQGIPGPAGLQGITGPAGLQGITGPAGPAGLQGIPGPTGPAGPGIIPDIVILPSVQRYFYIVPTDILSSATIPANEFTNDEGAFPASFPETGPNSYSNLYINGILQEGSLYSLSESALTINFNNQTIDSGTPIILEIIQFFAQVTS